jgi:hypothetical protein
MQKSPGLYGIPKNPNRSEILIITGSGHGSTNNRIRYLTIPVINEGPAMTLLNTAVLGTNILINEDGLYSISYTDRNEASAYVMGISRNATALTTSIGSLPAEQIAGIADGPSGGIAACLAVTLTLKAGDIIRPHSDGTPNNTSIQSRFRITKVND